MNERTMHNAPLTFAQFISLAENRSALIAVQELADNVLAERPAAGNPLLLHGPSGTGKSHLMNGLAERVSQARPELMVAHLTAGDFTQADFAAGHDGTPQAAGAVFALARDNDLLIVEDLQHLHASAVGPFTELVDELLAREQPLVFTADAGPQPLRQGRPNFPARLISRLAGGVVVGVQLPGEASRRFLLQQYCKRLNIGEAVLTWLIQHLTSVRQLLGAAQQLETLAAAGQPLDLDTVARQFQVQADAATITVEVIAQQVSRFFRVEPKQLRSQQRSRNVLLPRQVGMYLARRLTPLSLEQIGAYFGGRDHTTVLHACRKVERALDKDAALSGAVRQLQAELV